MEQEIAKKANSNDVAVRKQALNALVANDNWFEKKELVSIFLNDPEQEIQNIIVEKILKDCHQKFIPSLKLIARSEDEKLRGKVLSVLANSEKFTDLALLLERLPLESQMIQGLIKQGILRIIKAKPEKSLHACIEALASNNENVRIQSFKIFDVFEDKKAYVNELCTCLKSANASVKELIYKTIAGRKGEITTFAKEIFAEKKDMQILNLLNYFKDPDLEDLLVAEIESQDWSLRLNSIHMLAKMKSEKAKPKLIELLPNPNFSLEVISALRFYKDNEVGVAFLRRLARSNEQEQAEILKGIDDITTDDKRYVEPLLVFALHEVSTLDSKKHALEIVKKISKSAKLELPEKIKEVQAKIKLVEMRGVPDLGLKLAEE